MSYTLDTTVFIDVLRNHEPAVAFLGGLDEPGAASEITRVEVLRGLRSAERLRMEALFDVVRWQPVNERIARLAGELGRRYRRSHSGVGATDLIVAATSEIVGVPVATSNTKHFPMYRGLKAPY